MVRGSENRIGVVRAWKGVIADEADTGETIRSHDVELEDGGKLDTGLRVCGRFFIGVVARMIVDRVESRCSVKGMANGP